MQTILKKIGRKTLLWWKKLNGAIIYESEDDGGEFIVRQKWMIDRKGVSTILSEQVIRKW